MAGLRNPLTDAVAWRRGLIIGLLYFLSSAATLRFTRYDGGAAFLWVSTAILLAELSLRSPRRWGPPLIACTLAAVATTAWFGVGIAAAALFVPFAVGEAALAAIVLRQLQGRGVRFGSVRGVVLFLAVAGATAPALSGLGGAAIIAHATGLPYWPNWAHWTIGRALGNITFTPLMTLILSGDLGAAFTGLTRRRKIEAAALALGMIALSWAVFAQTAYPLLFLPMLPMIIATFRFGRFGGAIAVAILAVIGGLLTISGDGPVSLIHTAPGQRALFFQFYLAISVLMTLPVAAELNQRKLLYLALRESEARYRLIAEGSSDVILNLTVQGEIRYASPSIAKLGGYDPIALVGRNAGELVIVEDRVRVAAIHARALAEPQGTFIVEYRGLTATGGVIWCETHTRAISDDEGRALGVVSAIRDISAHKVTEAELARAATTDALTGLVNRRAFDEALERRLEDARAGRGVGCCAILDLDFFKKVNDVHGHAAGDQVLRVFANVAAKALRESDLLARIGGEEFGAILWGATPAEAHRICDRLRQEVAELLVETAEGAQIRFTMSGGVAAIDPRQSRSTILREADEALYRAKGAGRNQLAMAA